MRSSLPRPVRLLPIAALLLLAGCASPSERGDLDPSRNDEVATPGQFAPSGMPDGEPESDERPAREVTTIEGRYRALKPLGERLHEEGGWTDLPVAGWSDVWVTLDPTIEVDLVLLPPGCAELADPCALRFSPPEDRTFGEWRLGAMAAGDWTVVVQADADDYTFVDGLYEVHFDRRA